MKPLKPELDALREVLLTPLEDFLTEKEQDTHKDPESLAQTRMFTRAIEAVDEARGQRTTYTVVLRFGQGSSTFYMGYGPYSTRAQAEESQAGRLAAFQPTAYAIVPCRNQEGLVQMLTDLDREPEPQRVNKTLDKAKLKDLNGCIHKDRHHLRAGHKEIKPIGNVWDIRKKEGLSS